MTAPIPPGTWRVGTSPGSNGQNLWIGEKPNGRQVGRVDSAELARAVVEAMNAVALVEDVAQVAALRADVARLDTAPGRAGTSPLTSKDAPAEHEPDDAPGDTNPHAAGPDIWEDGWADGPKRHLWPCDCLPNGGGARRVGCPDHPEGVRGEQV